MQSKKIIFIFGPTASGKTDFGSLLVNEMPSEVINMDSAQCYTALSIGTAKPDWRSSLYAQHLFDCVQEPRNFTVHEYRKIALAKIEEIWAANKTPIFIGGSGFYLKSMLFPPEIYDINSDTVSMMTDSPADLWQQLYSIDPERAQAIHPHDIYRISRALAIWHTTGNKPSVYKPSYNPPASFVLLYVTRTKEVLYNRIDTRVHTMLHAGWLQEVTSLMDTPWESFVQEKGFIGYTELIGYLRHAHDLAYATKLIQQKTRNYAKRQETFWRMLKKSLHMVHDEGLYKGKIIEFDLTYPSLDLYIKQLLKDITELDVVNS